MSHNLARDAESVSRIVQDAGGRLVGRTRLQKIGFLLEVMGFGDGFSFSYKHYGPYSEQLSSAAQTATALSWILEREYEAAWGGKYSVFETCAPLEDSSTVARKNLVHFANETDAVELELAATVLLFAIEGYSDPWTETSHRKSSKVGNGRLDKARKLVGDLKQFDVNNLLPAV